MTTRKPTGMSTASWIDQQVNAARARGAFDALPGKGKPIPGLSEPRDEMWWVRDLMKREGLSYLPETLAIKQEVHEGLGQIYGARSQTEARAKLMALNARIREVNRFALDGPPSTTSVLDESRVMTAWEAAREAREATAASRPAAARQAPEAEAQAGWWVLAGLALVMGAAVMWALL